MRVHAGTCSRATWGALKGDSGCAPVLMACAGLFSDTLLPAAAMWFLLSSFLLAFRGSVKVFTVIGVF